MLVIWIGKYQSDISYTNHYFAGSITYFGDGSNNNVYYCSDCSRNYSKPDFLKFIVENIKQISDKHNFVFYNQSYAYEIINLYPKCKKQIININSKELINWLSNKTLVRLWVKNIINVPPFCAVPGNECQYSNLKSLFPQERKFVVQDNFSSGGTGSFIIDNHYKKKKIMLNQHQIYLVSPLLENSFSINLHILVDKKEQVIFPISIQVIEANKSPLIYRGADFIEAKKIPENITNKLKSCAQKIGRKLAGMGYRGICGLDFIIQYDKIYFIEINPRFQGSSFLLNRALLEKNLPSLYELSENTFLNQPLCVSKEELENLNVNYSYYKVKSNNPIPHQLYSDYINCPEIDTYFMDGFIPQNVPVNGYIFRFISNRNIVSINPNGQINIYQNLLIDSIISPPILFASKWNGIKTLLLTQGIKLHESAIVAVINLGGINEGTFDAIDIKFNNGLVVNCPLKIPFICFSPLILRYINNNFELMFFDNVVGTVDIDKSDNISPLKTHSGLLCSKIVQRNNNRIRIRHNSMCIFKQNGRGCYFCHAKNEEIYQFDLEDIKESFLFYLENTEFDQIMIGGASNSRECESALIKNIINIVRKYTNKSLYIMSIPPADINEIKEYKKLGANEIAFNMEIFDENIARTLMPEKGMISRREYLKALEKAVEVFGTDGQVRSMLIVGLE